MRNDEQASIADESVDVISASVDSVSIDSASVDSADAESIAAELIAAESIVADEILLAAVDVARAALTQITPADTIGEPVGHIVEDEHVLSLLFDCLLTGYPGWHWTVTLSRIDQDAAPTVLETELMPGNDALLAPEWVPWSDRLAEHRTAQELAAAQEALEGADDDAEGDESDDSDDFDDEHDDDDDDHDDDDHDDDDDDDHDHDHDHDDDDAEDALDEDSLDHDDFGDDALDGVDFEDDAELTSPKLNPGQAG